MTSARRRPARFVLTRVAVAALAVATFVGLWASIALGNQEDAPGPGTVVYEVLGVQTIAGTDPVIVVERQPIRYVDRYVDSQGNPVPGPALPSQSVTGSAPMISSTQDQPQPRAPTARKSRGS